MHVATAPALVGRLDDPMFLLMCVVLAVVSIVQIRALSRLFVTSGPDLRLPHEHVRMRCGISVKGDGPFARMSATYPMGSLAVSRELIRLDVPLFGSWTFGRSDSSGEWATSGSDRAVLNLRRHDVSARVRVLRGAELDAALVRFGWRAAPPNGS